MANLNIQISVKNTQQGVPALRIQGIIQGEEKIWKTLLSKAVGVAEYTPTADELKSMAGKKSILRSFMGKICLWIAVKAICFGNQMFEGTKRSN
ncbi:MAG: hypothetical protein IPN33_23090 [Saprospiraceae bacterium]|nr:hypothetical protein [Saprospiraceae bacterium]